MKRLLAVAWIVCSALLMVRGGMLLLAPPRAAGTTLPVPTDPRTPPGKYHPGVKKGPVTPSPCVAGECHGSGIPHRSGKGAAFLNGHVATLDCTACHLLPPAGTGTSSAISQGRRGFAPPTAVDTSHRLPAGWVFLPRRQEGCRACHSPGGSFPWEQLGFDSARRSDLADLAQASIIDQGSPWVIPNF
jgi:hypothetical protein